MPDVLWEHPVYYLKRSDNENYKKKERLSKKNQKKTEAVCIIQLKCSVRHKSSGRNTKKC